MPGVPAALVVSMMMFGAGAAAARDASGDWLGTLSVRPGLDLRIAVHIASEGVAVTMQLTKADAFERIELLAIQCEGLDTFTNETYPEAAALVMRARALLLEAASLVSRVDAPKGTP